MGTYGLTTQDELVKVIEVDILTVEERNVVDRLVANMKNRVYNQEEHVGGTQGMDETVCATQGN